MSHRFQIASIASIAGAASLILATTGADASPTARHGFNNIRVTPYPTSLSTSAQPYYYRGVQYYYDRGIYYQKSFYGGRTVYIPVARG